MHLRSKSFWLWMAAAGWLATTAGAMHGQAQQPSSPQAPTKQQPTAKQPSLTVDRDPVPSPDPDLPAQSQTGESQGVGLAKIEREGGKYTLRQDAYEVRLNATVLDGSGRSVQTLTRDAFTVYEDGVLQTIN